MSNNYIPTTWVGGKTVGTANVMNNLEQGIGSAHDRLDSVSEQFNTIVNLLNKDNLIAEISNIKNYSNVKLSSGIYELNGDILLIDNKHNVTLDFTDVEIHQNYHSYGILELRNCSDITIIGGKFIGSGNFPAQIIDNTLQTISNEKQDYKNTWGFYKNGEYKQYPVYNNGYLGNVSFGILIDYNNNNIIIKQSDVSNFNYTGIGIGFLGSQANAENKNITIDNCNCHNNFCAGIHVMNVDGARIINNLCDNNGHPSALVTDYVADPGYGITLRGADKHPKNIIVKDNICSNNKRKGLDVHSGHTFTFRDNTLVNNFMYGIALTKFNNKVVANAKILNNDLVNCSMISNGRGILADVDTFVIIDGNTITDCCKTQGTYSIAIDVSNGIAKITNNIIKNSGYNYDIYSYSKNVLVENNIIEDSVTTNPSKTSISLNNSAVEDIDYTIANIKNNYINIKNTNGIGLNVRKFRNGVIDGNSIFAFTKILVPIISEKSYLSMTPNNNILKGSEKLSTLSSNHTTTASFIINVIGGAISGTWNNDIISSVVSVDKGLQINFTKELVVTGFSYSNASSSNLPYLNNVYLRTKSYSNIVIGLGNTSQPLGTSANTLTQDIYICVNLTYI